jgi:hypothetical protein
VLGVLFVGRRAKPAVYKKYGPEHRAH